MKLAAQHVLIILTFGLLFSCGVTPEAQKILVKLQKIANEIPVHPSFTQLRTSHVIKTTNGVFSIKYHSSASYRDDVRDFYIKELTARGWSKFEEDSYGSDQEGMNFRKGEYEIGVFYDPTPNDWDYSIAYSWEKP